MILREPVLSDSCAVYDLVDHCKPLDLNSRYLYILICSHFRKTSIVAEAEGEIVGLISGYLLPEHPDTLFVWQVAVSEKMRGQRLAPRLLTELLERKAHAHVKWIHTTVTPSNIASRKFFQRFAKQQQVQLTIEPWLTKDLFGADAHEDEELFRIGPFHTK